MEELLNSIKSRSFDEINELSTSLDELLKLVEGTIVKEEQNDQ